jgi:hypothetical protein
MTGLLLELLADSLENPLGRLSLCEVVPAGVRGGGAGLDYQSGAGHRRGYLLPEQGVHLVLLLASARSGDTHEPAGHVSTTADGALTAQPRIANEDILGLGRRRHGPGIAALFHAATAFKPPPFSNRIPFVAK